MSDIKPHILTLAEKLKGEFTHKGNGTYVADEGSFERHMDGVNVSPDSVKHADQYKADYLAASGWALGELGLVSFGDDKKLDRVTIEIPANKDTIAHTFQRNKEVLAGIPQEGEERKTKTVYGVLTSRYVAHASGNRGELKKVKTRLGEMATEAMG